MLEQFLGPDDFRQGISNFLKAYKYSNAQTRDLWLELEKTSSKGYNVTKIMDTWTKQKGYPVVEVCGMYCTTNFCWEQVNNLALTLINIHFKLSLIADCTYCDSDLCMSFVLAILGYTR